MGAATRVLVSVLNFDVVEETIATLQCLQRQTYDSYDLELVDNGSQHDCVARIRDALPEVAVIQNQTNTGYAGGMNSILERGLVAGYEFVVVCNNDIEVEPEALAKLVAAARANEDAGLIGCVEVDYFSGEIRTAGGTGFSFWRARCNWSREISGAEGTSAQDYVQGAMVLFTRKALTSGVVLDDNLFMYYDEADVGFQLRRHGLRAYVALDVRVRHKAGRRLFDSSTGYYLQRNRVYMLKKHGRFHHLCWHVLYELLFELPAKFLVRSVQGRFSYAWACATGFGDGLLGRMGKRRGPFE